MLRTITFDEAECLKYYPFEGDFGSPGDRILSDRIVTTRKPAQCHMCLNPAEPGSRSRVLKAIYDGELRTYRWCSDCCAAMARVWDFDGDPFEERMRVRDGIDGGNCV